MALTITGSSLRAALMGPTSTRASGEHKRPHQERHQFHGHPAADRLIVGQPLVKSTNGTVALASAQTTAPGPAAPAPPRENAIARYSIRRRLSPVKDRGRPCCTTAPVPAGPVSASSRPGCGSLEHPIVYSFATWSSLVHNLGALDWSAFLFSF